MPRFTMGSNLKLDKVLTELSDTKEVPKSEIIRSAAAFYSYLEEGREAGKRITMVDEKNKRFRKSYCLNPEKTCMDADLSKTAEERSDFTFAGLAVLSPQTPNEVIQRTAFSYKTPKNPLEAAHEREMATSRERFRQTLTLLILSMMI